MPTGKTGKARPFTVEVKPGRSPCAGYSASELLNIHILGPIRVKLVTLKVTEGDKDIRQLSTWGETGEDVTVLSRSQGVHFEVALRSQVETREGRSWESGFGSGCRLHPPTAEMNYNGRLLRALARQQGTQS